MSRYRLYTAGSHQAALSFEAVQLLRSGNAICPAYEKYAFIGFNALTPCESAFFKSLQKQNRAIFFWDYDDYYLTNEWHEAGTFIRDNLQRFPPPHEWYLDTRNLATSKVDHQKFIEIVSVPSETWQAKIAGQLLSEEHPSDWSRTVIVFPDEHLLLPMLSSLPEAIRDINVTMGYPFTYSPAYSLFERLASLQQRTRMYSDGLRFYHQDVCAILYHPYIQELIPKKADDYVKSII